MRANGREVVRYVGSSETFCVGRYVIVLRAGSFSQRSSLTTLDFELPSRVTDLLPNTFSYCPHICFVTIPKSVRLIGEYYFYDCSGLSEVVFESPARVQMIESCTFSDCSSMTSFTVPSSVSILGDSVFRGAPNWPP
jgi:hypothetical protein